MANNYTICVGTVGAGVWFSTDGGASWKQLQLGDKMLNGDIHGVALDAESGKRYATTSDGIWTSLDEGSTWSLHGFPKFAERDTISYCRGVALKPGDPDTTFV